MSSVLAGLRNNNHSAQLHVQQFMHGGHEPQAHPDHPDTGDSRVSLGSIVPKSLNWIMLYCSSKFVEPRESFQPFQLFFFFAGVSYWPADASRCVSAHVQAGTARPKRKTAPKCRAAVRTPKNEVRLWHVVFDLSARVCLSFAYVHFCFFSFRELPGSRLLLGEEDQAGLQLGGGGQGSFLSAGEWRNIEQIWISSQKCPCG